MSKVEIFENGYLKSEFINPNYRGLVGWPSEYDDGDASGGAKIIAVCGGDVMNDSVYEMPLCNFKIPQFTPKDIPVGELCWVEQFTTDYNGWCPLCGKTTEFISGASSYPFGGPEECYNCGTTDSHYDMLDLDNAEDSKKARELKESNKAYTFHIKRSLGFKKGFVTGANKDCCIPYLIAETAEKAEELKDWAK